MKCSTSTSSAAQLMKTWCVHLGFVVFEFDDDAAEEEDMVGMQFQRGEMGSIRLNGYLLAQKSQRVNVFLLTCFFFSKKIPC